ncbi:MAG: 3-mercaptopyruvate sulfurtransferase [Rhodospirillaceae bacterium]|nr:3-mercaptopyruvate sulfurtransferase [Rhodospirillaceae bacterium]|tara:strand:- start:340 stop:1194 length:855 start_codon:yes stop_codon:yes gene_type:complete
MTTPSSTPIVTSEWLLKNYKLKNISIIDGSWHLPSLNRNAEKEFVNQHIPNSVFFDIDKIADTNNSLPHMIPSSAEFAKHVSALGITNHQHLIVYDTTGIGSAARVWWMFRLFGHDHISVLDGGLPAWKSLGPISSGEISPTPGRFKANFDRRLVRTLKQMEENLSSKQDQVLDARSQGRFNGIEPEPRKGLRSGHIPHSHNLPFTEIYDPDTKLLLSKPRLSELFANAGIETGNPIVASCGSGVTACNLALALYIVGNTNVAIYDGSWTEWGGHTDTPVNSQQ